MMIVYTLQTLLPSALVLWIALLPPRNLAGFWLLCIATTFLILVVGLRGVWMFPPWWVPNLMALTLVVAVIWCLIRAPARPRPPHQPCRIPSGGGSRRDHWLFRRSIMGCDLGASPATNAQVALIDLSHPLHAEFGGSGYGVDLIAVNRWGFRTAGIQSSEPSVTPSSARLCFRRARVRSW